MKISNVESNVLSSGGLGQTSTFKISTTAHAFKMLSSGLYSDKIAAVLREIGCNAHDAHISGGIAHKPIEVKLPNRIDSQFWIKDFGPGLSFDDVMGLYTTYFASTKQESDDFTGGFGLGSKSPFSYTDSFMITSCHGGKERVFTAHIGNDGSPKIAMMTETDTTDTGIRISFPVPAGDFASFQSKAQDIFQYFTPPPTILGGDDIKPAEYLKDSGHYAILAAPNSRGYQDIRVQMGNVVYPVNFQQLTKTLNTFVNAFSYSRGFLIRMPIGSLSVAASREELQYDPATIKAIIGGMEKIVKEICEDLQTQYAAVVDWPSRCEFSGLYAKINHGVDINEKLMAAVGIANSKALCDACHTRGCSVENLTGLDDITIAHCYESNKSSNIFRVTKDRPNTYNSNFTIPHDGSTVLIAGIATNAAQRIRKVLMDGKHDNVIAVYPAIGKVVTQTEIDKVVAIITKATGKIETIDLATLDQPTIVRVTKKKLAAGQFPEGLVFSGLSVQPPIKSSAVKAKIYARLHLNTRWGRPHPTVQLNGSTREIQEWEWVNLTGKIQTISNFHKLDDPVYITGPQMKTMRILKDASWEEYSVYLKRMLTDKTVLTKLRKSVADYVPSVNIHPSRNWRSTPLECLVHIKQTLPGIYDRITPDLRRVSVFSEVEKVHKVSNETNTVKSTTIPELISSYREVIQLVADATALADIPELDKYESAVNKKLDGKFSKLTPTLLADVAAVSEKACITILTEALA